MKKILSILGFATLLALNYTITQETKTVMQEQDQIMITIKENLDKYKQDPIDAKIENNTIIPGINGKEIDINETYEQMKKIGKFNEKYIKYKQTKPKITQEFQYDKYIISGNKQKNTISLIFIVKENDKIENIKNTLEKNKVKATFFIEKEWLKQNKTQVYELQQEGNTIGILNKNTNYEITELNQITQQKTKYCYAETENKNNIKICAQQKHYTIKPKITIESQPLKQIKQTLEPGELITIKINEQTEQELNLIINYIKTKGYNIETIEQHLSEKNTN